MGMHELSAVLWRERELLEVLHYKLEVERMLLANGAERWIGRATQEIEYVTGRLREIGLTRAVEADEVGAELGLAGEPTLREIVEATGDEVWRELLASHLAALLRLTGAITAIRDDNERMLRAANRAVQESLAGLGTLPSGYDASGRAAEHPTPRLVDEEI